MTRSLSIDNIVFPDRKSIIPSDTHLESIVDKAKTIDVDKINFDGEDFQPKTKIIQKQRVYLWMRLYLKNDIDILPETKVMMVYNGGEELLETYFMYFGKKGLERDVNGQIINFNPDDDKRVLCLLIDTDRLNVNCVDIPYIKTLFPLGKFYKPQYIKKMDFEFLIDGDKQIEFYDIDF